jgi:hypothetical protein
MAEDRSWPLIQRHGLLSTKSLLAAFEAPPDICTVILGERRTGSIPISSPGGEQAVIRDQIPLRLGPLERCLVDLNVAEWLDLLNAHVFFWVREERLLRLLNARAYRAKQHTVIVVRSEVLVARYLESVRLTPLNTGSTIFNPRPRGSRTFLPIQEFDFDARRRAAGSDAVVELAVVGGVAIDDEIVESVSTYRGGTRVATIHSS